MVKEYNMHHAFLERRMDNKWIFGVCSGIADRLGVKPLWVRLAFVVIPALPGGLAIPPVAIAYVIAGLLLPKQERFA